MRSILAALQEGRLFELPSTHKDEALEFLARILDANPDIGAGTDAPEEVKRREAEYNTGIGMGVGVPHLRTRRAEGELYCAIGWSHAGIDYGAPDGKPVHLVVMYYIPDAQKKIYLKEVSSLVKAIQRSGGIGPVAAAEGLTEVRNRLLDWVSSVGDEGPSAVARMIKLDVKQAAAPGVVGMEGVGRVTQVLPFSVVVSGAQAVVLAPDPELLRALEGGDSGSGLVPLLSDGRPFSLGGRHVFVTGSSRYAAGRVVHQCVALVEQGGAAASPPRPVAAPGSGGRGG